MENIKQNILGNLLSQNNIAFKPIDPSEEESIIKSVSNSSNESLIRNIKKTRLDKIETGYLENGEPFILMAGDDANIYLVSEELVTQIPMTKSNDGKFYGKLWANKKDGFALGKDELSYTTNNEKIKNSVSTRTISQHDGNGKVSNGLMFGYAANVFGQIPNYPGYTAVNNLLSTGNNVLVTESNQIVSDGTREKSVTLYCLWDSVESLENNGKPMVIAGRTLFEEEYKTSERYVSFVKNDKEDYEMINPSNNVYATSYSDYSEFEKDLQEHGMRPAMGDNSIFTMCKSENEPKIISAIRKYVELLAYYNKMNIAINESNAYIEGISVQTSRDSIEKSKQF